MRTAVALVLITMLAACSSSGSRPHVVVSGAAPPTAYSGPMHLSFVSNDEVAAVLDKSGAAGRALECTGSPYDGGGGAGYVDDQNKVRPTAASALEHWTIQNGAPEYKPAAGYRVERKDGVRVLFSWDVGARTKFAVIVADGQTDYVHHRGWGIELWAQCDPAEFPAATTDAMGLQIWTDRAGHRAPIAKVVSFPGEWCDLDATRLMDVEGQGAHNSYGYTSGSQLDGLTALPVAHLDAVPASAVDTGYRRDGRELWTSPSKKAVYLVALDDATDVELWPQLTASCAG